MVSISEIARCEPDFSFRQEFALVRFDCVGDLGASMTDPAQTKISAPPDSEQANQQLGSIMRTPHVTVFDMKGKLR